MLVFIVGCGRSGTTLLVAMLDMHPDLAIPGESDFIVSACRRIRDNRNPKFVNERFLQILSNSAQFKLWNIGLDALCSRLNSVKLDSAADAIRATYALYAEMNGKSLYGDKYPDHVLHMEMLADRFPESKFVHMIRDGRNVALSTLGVTWGPKTVEGCADFWQRRVRHGRRVGTQLGPDRYLEIKYEDLMAQPDALLHRVTDFLGIPFVSEMLDFQQGSKRQMSMSQNPREDRSLLLPLSPSLRDWQRDMSAEDARVFESIAGHWLSEYGYALSRTLSADEEFRVRRRLKRHQLLAPLKSVVMTLDSAAKDVAYLLPVPAESFGRRMRSFISKRRT